MGFKMRIISLIALLGLTASIQGVHIDKKMAVVDKPPTERDFLQCSNSVNSGDWDQPVPGLYEKSSVMKLDGEAARNELLSKDHLDNLPDFAVAYHPECPHCQTIVQSIEDLNSFINSKHVPVNLITINMSKTMQFLDDL